MLHVRSYRERGLEVALIRKDFHKAGRLYDCLRKCNLGRSGDKNVNESGFGEHDEGCWVVALFLVRRQGESSEGILSRRIASK